LMPSCSMPTATAHCHRECAQPSSWKLTNGTERNRCACCCATSNLCRPARRRRRRSAGLDGRGLGCSRVLGSFLPVGGLVPDPPPEQLIANRKNDRADEQAEDAGRGHATDRADQHDGHWNIDAPAEEDRFEHVVDQAGDEDVDRERDRRERRALSKEHEDNYWQRD